MDLTWIRLHVQRSPRWLIAIELISICGWFVFAFFFVQSENTRGDIQPLTKEALQVTQTNERWNGIFFHDQQAGFSVNRTSATADGTILMEQRSVLRVATFGKLQTIITAGAALTDPDGYLQRFDFFMKAESAQLAVRGEIQKNNITMEIDQGTGEIQQLDFPISRRPHVALSLEAMLRQTELFVGKELSVPYFDPMSMSDGEMRIRVVDTEILENGEEAWWLVSQFNDIETRSLVSSAGDILRQEGALGISMVRMTAEAAQSFGTEDDVVDLISLSAVPLEGKIKKAREKTELSLQFSGVSAEKIFHQPPLQAVSGNTITIQIPDIETLEIQPIALHTPAENQKQWLEPALDIPSTHPKIIEAAKKATVGASTRLDAIRKLNQFVFDYLEKTPVIGVPNGLSTLNEGKGDCNEHTVLFVSLARALGVPTRIAAGVVFSDRSGPIGQFYYHAWPEIWMENDIWIPVDPTFGQVPADATHIKLVEGGLDRQVEIMAFLGQLKLKVNENTEELENKEEKDEK